MISKDLLKTVIVDNQRRQVGDVWERNLVVPTESGKIVTLSGVRRSGKTYRLFRLINALKASGVELEKILYLNFEDERLELQVQDLDLILQAYRELYPNLDLSQSYFFFDEIQEIPNWEKFITRVYETISKKVFVTGSNSSLLSKEIATGLRGRTITYEIFPLSFLEYVKANLPEFNKFASEDRAKILNLFEKFLKFGGFPELIGKPIDLKQKILQEYFNVMLVRDLIERYDISQSVILRYFCKRVVGASAGEFSVNKIYKDIKSQGYEVGKDTLYEYQTYVENIYLNRFISKYSFSVVKAEGSIKKTYVIDSGLGGALDIKLAQDKGRLLETVVALELVKAEKQIAYDKNGSECDFVILDKSGVVQAIQVAWDLEDEKTKNREIKGLLKACAKYSLKEGFILTYEQKQSFEIDGVMIKVVPVWEYFLKN